MGVIDPLGDLRQLTFPILKMGILLLIYLPTFQKCVERMVCKFIPQFSVEDSTHTKVEFFFCFKLLPVRSHLLCVLHQTQEFFCGSSLVSVGQPPPTVGWPNPCTSVIKTHRDLESYGLTMCLIETMNYVK